MSIIKILRKYYYKVDKILYKPYFFVVDILMKRKNYVFSPSNLKSLFYLPYVKDDLIQQYIYRHKQYYEYCNLNYICKKWGGGVVGSAIADAAVLDIGANIGNHTLYYLNECNAKKAFCFEPIPDTFSILKKNMEINRIDRVELINAAVGENDGKAVVSHYDIRNTGGTTISLSKEEGFPLVSIDSLNIKDKIGMVKIDVEGFELSVIKGMMNTIDRDKPYLTVEVKNNQIDNIQTLLSPMGYEMEIIRSSSKYSDIFFYAN